MKTINIIYLYLTLTIIIYGCGKETIPTLTYPTSFTFNTPSLEDRSVYTIDSSYVIDATTNTKKLVWTFDRLGEYLGSYEKSNAQIADTLNYLIRNEFADAQNLMMSKITLLSATEMEIEYSKLIKDSLSPLNDRLEFVRKETKSYQQVGNILTDGMYINNDFREIYLCNEFILATKRYADNTIYQQYFKNTCNLPDPIKSLERFVGQYKDIKFDTASVEYVNYIFSSYK